MIYMIWKDCIPAAFYKYICQEEILFILTEKNVLQPRVSEIITGFLKQNEKTYVLLRNKLSQFKNIFH